MLTYGMKIDMLLGLQMHAHTGGTIDSEHIEYILNNILNKFVQYTWNIIINIALFPYN